MTVLLIACGTSTLKSPLLRAFFTPHVHSRLRKRLSRCTLDCGFKTPESPALRGFVGGPRALATVALYLVIFSNGLRHSKNSPVKFGFSPKTVSTNAAQKLPSQRRPQPLLIPIFNFSHKWPTFAFTGESGYTTRLSEKDRTQRLTRRNRGPSLLRTQRSFAPPAKSPPKEQPEKTDARQWRVSVFSGVATPLGCAVLIVSQFTLYISAYRLCATLYLSVGYWRGLHDNRKATLYQKQQGVSLSMVMWCPL